MTTLPSVDPKGHIPCKCARCGVVMNEWCEAEGCEDPHCFAQAMSIETERLDVRLSQVAFRLRGK